MILYQKCPNVKREHNTSYKRRVQESETYDETVKRREYHKKYKQTLRANENNQQTKQRQNMNRIQMAHNRLLKKFKHETVDDAMNNFKNQCKKQPV